MTYFSGFSLENEEGLFSEYLADSDYTVAGFSYGAQQAFEYTYHSSQRIDRLILLSPAFFQTQKPSFVRTQLRYFEANKEAYVTQFLENVAYPASTHLERYLKVGTKEALEALLSYVWEKEKIEALQKRGITIEVFVGDEDKIIDTKEAIAFFKSCTTLYTIKNIGHLLEQKL